MVLIRLVVCRDPSEVGVPMDNHRRVPFRCGPPAPKIIRTPVNKNYKPCSKLVLPSRLAPFDSEVSSMDPRRTARYSRNCQTTPTPAEPGESLGQQSERIYLTSQSASSPPRSSADRHSVPAALPRFPA